MWMILWVVLSVAGCDSKQVSSSKQGGTVPNGPGEPSSNVGSAALHEILDSGRDVDMRWPDFSPQQEDVKAFYSQPNDALAWLRDGQPTPQALAFIAMFEQAANKGLTPEDYDATRWADRLSQQKTSPNDANNSRFDAAVTVSLLRYVRALGLGRVNPKGLGQPLDVNGQKMDLAVFLRQKLKNAADPSAEMNTIEPPWPGYWRRWTRCIA